MTQPGALERVLTAAEAVLEAREDQMLTRVEWEALGAAVRNARQNPTERDLRATIGRMAPEDYGAVRDAYYKAVEGLRALADSLEAVDLKVGPHNDGLLEEHLIACAAITTMKKSMLGKVL